MAWNFNYLLKKLHYYKKLRKNETDVDKQLKLEETIGSIEEVFDYLFSSVIPQRQSYKTVYEMDTEFQKEYCDLNPFIFDFLDRFENEEITYEVDFSKIPGLNRNKILSITADFYREIRDERFVEPSRKLNLRSDELVRFKKSKITDANANDAAITLQIYNTEDILMLIKSDKTIQDIISTIHEYAHSIAFLINQDHSTELGKFPYVEVDSIFFEMLGTEYAGSVLNMPTQALNIDIDRFYDYLLSALIIVSKLNVHTMINDGKLNKKDIINYLKIEENLDDDEIKSVLYRPMSDYYHYVISYLTAIELYIIYQDFPEAALDALHEIITSKDMKATDYLKMLYDNYGIVLGQNTHVYFDILKNRIDVLMNGKQIQYTN